MTGLNAYSCKRENDSSAQEQPWHGRKGGKQKCTQIIDDI